MATSNADDLKPIASPLDLSLKVVNITKTIKEEESNNSKCLDDQKSVSSEELLSLKLLHDRLSKTMELLLPQEKLKKIEEIKSTQMPSSTTDKMLPEFDYKTTMKALLSLVESENITSNDEEEKHMSSFFPTKMPCSPHVDSWSYWHDYILSLYLMNSSLNSSLPPPPPIPPPPIPPTSLSTSLFPPPFNFLPPQNSMLFQNMLSNLINRSPIKPPDDNTPKPFLQENLNQDFGYKNKKLNSYQFLKDSNLLYNSFATSRNLGLTKTKLLDSPESFGVSLRGNQKYSIYYQQRPNNIFNNNFLSPTCSSTMTTKQNHNSNYKNVTNHNNNNNHYYSEEHNRKSHTSSETGYKKTMLANNNKIHKTMTRTESASTNSKMSSEKSNKYSSYDHGSYNNNNSNNNTGSNNVIPLSYEPLPITIPLVNRYRETVFNCSCGQDFENLYSFTIHMKSTHHSPNSSKIERSIPKLVRGQDMWINSETEQTKEILRCMRCHQSFRTLPELTMHMVETNHYSEIVYSDTGKCVFLNSDHDKIKPSYTTISSPVSSPGDIIRKLKRTFSSSTGSDIGVEEENVKKRKISTPTESYNLRVKELSSKEAVLKVENLQKLDMSIDITCDNEKIIKNERILQIKEADSGTVDTQPDSDSSSTSKIFKNFDSKDSIINSTNTCDSVIRQIENFVEKSLPKPLHNEYSNVSSAFSTTNTNHKTTKSSTKCINSKSNNLDKIWRTESKMVHNEKIDSSTKHKEKTSDIINAFNFKNYPVSSSENLENPLSSLQMLVETIQKNSAQVKDQSVNNYKMNQLHNKDLSSYSYSTKSPEVCDSLSQLQALVAGTSVNNSQAMHLKQNEQKGLGYCLSERNKTFPPNSMPDSSETFLTWCHKLGELLGLPQALSQAMLTQDAIKDLANSVIMMNSGSQSSLEANNSADEENNNNNNGSSEIKNSDSEMKSFQGRDCDPIEQLKNLLNSTSDPAQSNHSQIMTNKFINGSNLHSTSPPAISKKAKCHFCNKPFANKGQVRLHISKGKCPSLMRSCHSSCNQMDQNLNRTMSPLNYDSSLTSHYKLKETNNKDIKDVKVKSDVEGNSDNSSRDNMISNKSVNLIREYFKFAKQMIGGNDDHCESVSSKIESNLD